MKKNIQYKVYFILTVATIFCIIMISGCIKTPVDVNKDEKKNYEGKKVLFINSYHEGYLWSDGEVKGAKDILEQNSVEVKVVYMNTLENKTEEFAKNKALEMKSLIEEYKPDVVITSDDSAFKYVIMPYYQNAELPVVFCGVNWNASVYNAPYKNTAGMVEVPLISKITEITKEYAKGDRVGFLTGDTLSEHRNAENWNSNIPKGFAKIEFVKTFDEWKTKYLQIQEEVDILLIGSSAGIENWNEEDAKKFVLENTKIPSGTELEMMMSVSLIGIVKVAEEQGEWAGQTVLRIFDGVLTSSIPVEQNKKGVLFVNLQIAEKQGIVFSPSILKNAEIYELKEERK